MDPVPKAFVAGVYIAAPPPTPGPNSPGPFTREVLTRIFAEVTALYPYQSLQLAPQGDAAQFLGSSVADFMVIQPPILQVADPLLYGVDKAAEKARDAFRIVERHLGSAGVTFLQLGVKLIYHAPAPPGGAKAFVLSVLGGDEQFEALRGGGNMWAGLKAVVDHAAVSYTLLLEPFVADDSFIYLDLDAQLAGPVDLDHLRDKVRDTERFMTQAVKGYLEQPRGG